MLPALLGEKTSKPLRDHLVLQNNNQNPLALRQGEWVLIQKGVGPRASEAARRNPGFELYNLANDLSQTNNLAAQQPERVNEMRARLNELREQGRSR